MRTQKKLDLLAGAMFLLLLAACLTSCMTAEKATNYLRDKQALAAVCAIEFPARDCVVVRNGVDYTPQIDSLLGEIKSISGKTNTILKTDTIRLLDSAKCNAELAAIVARLQLLRMEVERFRNTEYKPCRDSIIHVRNTAFEALLQQEKEVLRNQLKAAEQSRDEWREKAKRRGRIIGFGGGALALLLVGWGFMKINKKRRFI